MLLLMLLMLLMLMLLLMLLFRPPGSCTRIHNEPKPI